jgi:hypothetical protein
VSEKDRPVSCALCGVVADVQPLTWTTSLEGGQTRYYCDRCSRDNLRAMEGRLDADWF